ncbi:MAG: PorT family protein [Alistipes sp.]|nr:PorT family protein [Alistipes sp.]
MKSKLRDIIVAIVAAFVLMASGTEATAQSSEYSFYSHEETPKVRMEWGVGVGATYTGVKSISTDIVSLKPRLGLAGHFDMAVRIGRNFAVETEIHYEGGSISVATPKVEHRVRTRTMDIPVLLSLRMANNRIRLSAGPLFTVMSRAEYTQDGEIKFFGPTNPTWNVAAGVGIGLTRHLLIEARYVHPLKSSINQFDGIEFSTRSYRVTAGLTLLF